MHQCCSLQKGSGANLIKESSPLFRAGLELYNKIQYISISYLFSPSPHDTQNMNTLCRVACSDEKHENDRHFETKGRNHFKIESITYALKK